MSSHATAQYQQDTVVSAEAFRELHNLLADRLTTAKAVREEHAKMSLITYPTCLMLSHTPIVTLKSLK